MVTEVRVSYRDLCRVIEDALAAAGVPEYIRRVEAEIMAEADLMGVPSHGVRMLPGLLKGLREGLARPDPQLKILRDQAATCLLDGDRGPGRYVSWYAMQQAMDRALRFGVGLCLATRVTHWGRAHAYADRSARRGLVGICATNAIPSMAGFGATQPLLGNNPLAIGVPRGGGQDPVVLDIAMSQAAVGKVVTYLREGRRVPQDWGLDAQGQPTDDPAAILSAGAVLPMGGHKGAGLALMIELLTGALAGGLLSHEMARGDSSGLDSDASKLFLAIDPGAFAEVERFDGRVDDMLAYLAETAGNTETWLYPGQRGLQARDRGLAEGISIHPQIVEQLAAAGVRLD